MASLMVICPKCGGDGGAPGSDFGDHGFHACYFCGMTGYVTIEALLALEEQERLAIEEMESGTFRPEWDECDDLGYDPRDEIETVSHLTSEEIPF